MALIATSGGNTAGFLLEHAGREGVFQKNFKDDKEKHQFEKGWAENEQRHVNIFNHKQQSLLG